MHYAYRTEAFTKLYPQIQHLLVTPFSASYPFYMLTHYGAYTNKLSHQAAAVGLDDNNVRFHKS